ncbi:TPA: hypothetical protein ACTV5X_004595 [Enterobacter roggenkampii]|uniref:hypothetical protein n=1 Tax=Enterobacter roggenkampii TaxID=1812935 RepID=UPI003BD63DC0|nr:hypothetical protein [Enterobacter roggenkampii]HCR1933096.1 hypothetical protein [Enterobacter roggenkampii]
MKKFVVLSFILPIFLASCSWDPSGANAQREWIAQKKTEQVEQEKRDADRQRERLADQKQKEADFNASHPEVKIADLPVDDKTSAGRALQKAANDIGFVTRFPESKTPDNVYVRVGSYNLTLRTFLVSIQRYSEDCKRASAYTNVNYDNACTSALAESLSNFASMIKDDSIPNLTKSTALREAMYGDYIEFDHAARLAKMHTTICSKQGGKGYAEMMTLAVPCSGKGDVLYSHRARQMGLI